MAGSLAWGYVRIMAGTLLGGALGFYVMHQIELSYKEKMEEELRQYEMEKIRREKREQQLQLNEFGEESM